MTPIARILCPVDFSDFSRRALDHAAVIARWYEATIAVVHVMPAVPDGAGGVPDAAGPLMATSGREVLMEELRAFVQPVRDSGVTVDALRLMTLRNES